MAPGIYYGIIGQGIEFDYCCVHASYALKELGIESIMVNSNPETVSTDYDVADKLYFEPLTYEDALEVIRRVHHLTAGVPRMAASVAMVCVSVTSIS